MPLSLPFSLPLMVLTACGPKVTDQNINALNSQFEAVERTGKSMSLKEVESIMGPPTRSESFPIEMRTVKELPGVRYYYDQDGKTVVLHFVDNRLIRRVLKFGEDPAEEKDRPGYRTPLQPMPEIDTTPVLPAGSEPDKASTADAEKTETVTPEASPVPKEELLPPEPPLPDKPN